MDKYELPDTDWDSIVSQIEHQEKQLKLKRRWLLELSALESKHDSSELPEFLPESLIREDDILYETIKSHVLEAYGLRSVGNGSNVGLRDSEQVVMFGNPNAMRSLATKLQDLSNKGLYLIATILTEGSIEFEKTRPRMTEIISRFLSKGFGKKKHNNNEQQDILGQLNRVLNDPRNFRKDFFSKPSPSIQYPHHDAAVKVLDELESLPFQTLVAMKRKLKGVRTIPQLKARRFGQSRSHLIKQVRKASQKMLLERDVDDQLQEPLAKAMAVVDLTVKLTPGYQNATSGGFYQFSPEIRNLQNEIVKAIRLLKKEVKFLELKTLQQLLDPKADIPNNSLRTAIKKMLTEYLFECSDMDTIPKSLLQALQVVNRSSLIVEYKVSREEIVEEEVESVLSISAQMKQIALDLLPNCELDQDFCDAYMEELEESDDGYYDDNDDDDDDSCDDVGRNTKESATQLFESDHEESIGECIPIEYEESTCVSSDNSFCCTVGGMPLAPLYANHVIKGSRPLLNGGRNNIAVVNIKDHIERDEVDSRNQLSSRSCFSSGFREFDSEKPDKSKNQNQYLAVQQICDETSMAAYNLIGRLLETFAEEKGVELDYNDRLYLEGGSAFDEENTIEEEKQPSSGESSSGSTIIEVVKKLMPCLEESALAKLKELMDKR